jgi:SAM-dependent methyltransferase
MSTSPPTPRDPSTSTALATSFGRQTAAYNVGRPEYPLEAVRWMLGAQPIHHAADVGAGTGKLTAALLAEDRAVTAIDPDDAMLVSLTARLPGLRTLAGRGEALPLPDESVDAVTYGQAWHWVDEAAAAREAARVLRPGGVLGLIWNVRDPAVPWVAELTEIMGSSPAEEMMAGPGPRVDPSCGFGPLERLDLRWTRPMTHDEVRAMAASRSALITAPAQERERILDEVRRMLTSHRALAGRDVVDMPYITSAFRALRTPRTPCALARP